MRPLALIAASAAISISAPAMAQSTGERLLGRVLDAVLAPEEAEETVPVVDQSAMGQVLSHARRDSDRVRDQYRHPAQTLDFFRVTQGQTVVDFMPSSGWYSRVLIPYLGSNGTYIGLNPNIGEGGPQFFQSMRDYDDSLPGQARDWVGYTGARVIGGNVGSVPEELEGTVDRFLIFREIHNIRRFGWFHDVAVAARSMLKDDGLLGVVQHRAKDDAPADYVLGNNGYQREQDVIGLFSAYGFELVSRSEINANPADPADWEIGPWQLAPGFAGAEEGTAERARRAEIGESDRMTLLFRKRQ